MSYNKTIWHARDIITATKMQKIEDQLEALSESAGMNIHICANNEYNTISHMPVIDIPSTSTIYLVPDGNNSNNLYAEWVYVNNAWEKFGTGTVSFTETDPTVPSWAKAAQKPTYTAQEVGALPNNTTIPSKVSDLTNDAGYLTQHQDISGKANSADLAAIATSGAYSDLINKPQIIAGTGNNAIVINQTSTSRSSGDASVAEGSSTASGNKSHAEGWSTQATATGTHSEGYFSRATSSYAHAENGLYRYGTVYLSGAANATTYTYDITKGYQPTSLDAEMIENKILNYNSTVYYVSAIDLNNHTITVNNSLNKTTALSSASVSFGSFSLADGTLSHAEGNSYAKALGSHAEGFGTISNGQGAHAEGQYTYAHGNGSHAEGINNIASGTASHAEGYYSQAEGAYSHAEGIGIAGGDYSHAENHAYADGDYSHAEGYGASANGDYSHAEGDTTKAVGIGSHAEGLFSIANGNNSHAENGKCNIGTITISGLHNSTEYTYTNSTLSENDLLYINNKMLDNNGERSFISSINTTTKVITTVNTINFDEDLTDTDIDVYAVSYTAGAFSHSEGASYAKETMSHAEGQDTTAVGTASHTEGVKTVAIGLGAHAEGIQTIANGMGQHVLGMYNIQDTLSGGNYIEIIGNGTADNARSNARTLDWSGNEALAGSLTLGKNTANEITITAEKMQEIENQLEPSYTIEHGTGLWVQGGIHTSSGNFTDSTHKIHMAACLDANHINKITCTNDVKFIICGYNKLTYEFIGLYQPSGWIKTTSSDITWYRSIEIPPISEYGLDIMVANDDTSTDITPTSVADKINFYIETPTDINDEAKYAAEDKILYTDHIWFRPGGFNADGTSYTTGGSSYNTRTKSSLPIHINAKIGDRVSVTTVNSGYRLKLLQYRANGTLRAYINWGKPTLSLIHANGCYYCVCIQEEDTSSSGFDTSTTADLLRIYIEKPLKKPTIICPSKKDFCIMSYNVGQWYIGSGSTAPYENLETYETIQRSIIERYAPDIFCAQEYTDYVQVLGDYYNNLYKYNPSNTDLYIGKMIASNYVHNDSTGVNFTSDTRNYAYTYMWLGGHKVCVVSAHLAYNASDKTTASNQLAELKAFADTQPYIIICIDTNLDCSSKSDQIYIDNFKLWIDDNYNLANMDKFGFMNTVYRTNAWACCDNIITSNNININYACVDTQKDVSGITQDHLPLIAYVSINDTIPALPTTNGNYMLQATVSDGVVTYNWAAAT